MIPLRKPKKRHVHYQIKAICGAMSGGWSRRWWMTGKGFEDSLGISFEAHNQNRTGRADEAERRVQLL